MSDILGNGLREQLAAALLGWGGADGAGAGADGSHRNSRDTIDSHAHDRGHGEHKLGQGRDTPKPAPSLGREPLQHHHHQVVHHHRQGHIRAPADDIDDDRTAIDDDIDADSVEDDDEDRDREDARDEHTDENGHGDEKDRDHHGGLHRQHPPQPRRTAERPTPATQKALPPLPQLPLLALSPLSPLLPLPAETTHLASPPEMSCRISRFPFAHPCEVPELMPDQEDMFGMATSPSVSGPATPRVVPDAFRSPTAVVTPEGDVENTPEPAPHTTERTMSIKSAQSDRSDGLGIIHEEEDDRNTDGVSLLTPTEVSFPHGPADAESESSPRADQPGRLAVEHGGHWRSVSSLGSGSSGEWRPSLQSNPARRSNLFARMRGRPAEEEFLEKRSLTPIQLTAPPRGLADAPLSPNSAGPVSPSFPATSATSRFFNRMPWLGDSQSRKPDAVFGVDLKESMRVAPMKIRISHRGRGTSYRTFPVSVYKCCEFIRRAGTSPPPISHPPNTNIPPGGTDAHIFSSPGNPSNIATLKTIFSLPPHFGETFQFEGSPYTVHDAAQLILHFLESLPKPLISASVIRSWILLARQEGAIEPPCPRVETGLDFWTEALNRLPTASRNLTKHLLTLFAEVLLAAAGGISEADARQLASAVARGMFHQEVEGGNSGVGGNGGGDGKGKKRRNVQPTLALAFLIKKRGEYALSLSEAAGAGAGSKRDTRGFLPSTQEMMEWKSVGL